MKSGVELQFILLQLVILRFSATLTAIYFIILTIFTDFLMTVGSNLVRNKNL
jgi:hypothetical protein